MALAAVGIVATAVGFAAGGPSWGWRILGLFLLAMAAWVFLVGHAGYLIPGFRPGYLGSKAAGALTLANAAVGLLVLWHAEDLAAWSYTACAHVPLLECKAARACASSDVVAVTSPARNFRAVAFTQQCDSGAPTTHVSILAVGEPLGNQAGNVLVLDGKAQLTLLWTGGRDLAIAGLGSAVAERRETNVNGVRIAYDQQRR
jgi:hypothetical protein